MRAKIWSKAVLLVGPMLFISHFAGNLSTRMKGQTLENTRAKQVDYLSSRSPDNCDSKAALGNGTGSGFLGEAGFTTFGGSGF